MKVFISITFTAVSLPFPYQFFHHALIEELTKELGVSMDLGQLIASSCRQKILETLSRCKETHLMDLVRQINSTYTQVNRNLQILKGEEIVRIRFYGRLKMISLNHENPRTDVILKALKLLRNAEIKRVEVKLGEN